MLPKEDLKFVVDGNKTDCFLYNIIIMVVYLSALMRTSIERIISR